MLANESKRIRKGGQGFAIPGRLSNGKRLLTQQLLSKNGHERKECQQGRSGAHNRQIRPLALGLDAQMSTNLMKGDFNSPTQDKPLHDLESLCILIGTQQGHGLVPAFWITNEHPTDRPQGEREIDTTAPCQWRSPSLALSPHTRTASVFATASQDR